MTAEDALDINADLFASWLFGECVGRTAVTVGYMPRGDELSEMVEKANTPTLVALLIYPRSEVAGAAAWELRNRYVSALTGGSK